VTLTTHTHRFVAAGATIAISGPRSGGQRGTCAAFVGNDHSAASKGTVRSVASGIIAGGHQRRIERTCTRSYSLPGAHVSIIAFSHIAVIGLSSAGDAGIAGRAGGWRGTATTIGLGRVALLARWTSSRARAKACAGTLYLGWRARGRAVARAVTGIEHFVGIRAHGALACARASVLDMVDVTCVGAGALAIVRILLVVGIVARRARACAGWEWGRNPADRAGNALARTVRRSGFDSLARS
jgi:hypothetical protein